MEDLFDQFEERDWRINITEIQGENLCVRVGKFVPNTIPKPRYSTTDEVNFSDIIVIKSSMQEREILMRILAVMMALSEHEAMEGFRRKGQRGPILDPHIGGEFSYTKRCEQITRQLLAPIPPLPMPLYIFGDEKMRLQSNIVVGPKETM